MSRPGRVELSTPNRLLLLHLPLVTIGRTPSPGRLAFCPSIHPRVFWSAARSVVRARRPAPGPAADPEPPPALPRAVRTGMRVEGEGRRVKNVSRETTAEDEWPSAALLVAPNWRRWLSNIHSSLARPDNLFTRPARDWPLLRPLLVGATNWPSRMGLPGAFCHVIDLLARPWRTLLHSLHSPPSCCPSQNTGVPWPAAAKAAVVWLCC